LHLNATARRRTFYASVATVATAGLLVVGTPKSAPVVDSGVAVGVLASNDTVTQYDPPSVGAQESLALESYLQQKGPAAAQTKALAQATLVTRPKVDSYVVVEGDSLGLIADRFDLKLETLLWANDMEDGDVINPGQELMVPAVDGVVHTVTNGDTLSEIASFYAAELDHVVESNPDINPGLLKPGDVLVIPGGQPGIRRLVASARSGGRSDVRTFEQWPASGPLTDYFGWRVHPVFGTSHYHDGIDIGAPDGSPVRAVSGGTVTMATRYGGYGLTVKIDHGGGVVTQYAHLSQSDVVVGEKVDPGQKVGNVGNTGNSTGPHLHFSVFLSGDPTDPASWLP
jgi:LysM repeat protein